MVICGCGTTKKNSGYDKLKESRGESKMVRICAGRMRATTIINQSFCAYRE